MSLLRSLALSFVLVGICIVYVPTRGEVFGPALCGDARWYAAMIDGSEVVAEPYRFRLLVPLLASLLPLSPSSALAAVSWASLLATYTLLLETARRLHIARLSSAVGLAAAIFTAPHLYNYFNPYLTDASGLLALTVALYALVTGRHVLFTIACTLGAAVREPVVCVAPAWGATRQWRRTAASVALSAAALLAVRLSVGPSGLPEKGPFVFPARPLSAVFADALVAWNGLWLIVPIGLSLVSVRRRELAWFSAFLLASALVTSLLASDTMRMFQPLFPCCALGLSVFVEQLWRTSRAATVALLVSFFATSWVWQPVRFLALTPHSRASNIAQASALGLLAFVAVVAVLVWRRADGLRSEAQTEAA